MPVAYGTILDEYTGNGSTTIYPYTFPVGDTDEVKVYLDGVEQTTGFTTSGGNVTFDTAPSTDVVVRLIRYTQPDRDTDYTAGGGLAADTLDEDVDRLVRMIQELYQRTPLYSLADDTLDFGDGIIGGVATPVDSTDAANKAYVDALDYKVKIDAADTAGYLGTKILGGSDVTIVDGGTTLTINIDLTAVDAITLQGNAASAFATAGHNHDTDYYSQTQVDSIAAGKTDIGHTHDTRYYTETEMDTLLASKEDTGHTHIKSDITDFSDADYLTSAGTETVTGLKNFTGGLQSGGTAVSVDGHSHSITGTIQFTLPTGKNDTYVVMQSLPAMTITGAVVQSASGTITADVQMDAVSITGLSAINITSTEGTATATANNVASGGEKLTITLSANSSAEMVSICLTFTRTV